MTWHFLFGVAILALSTCGVCTNSAALVLLTKRQRGRSSMFHQLIKMLSFYDLLVVGCGALSYGLPNVLPSYEGFMLPRISPYLIPTVHIALMSSVYCTVRENRSNTSFGKT